MYEFSGEFLYRFKSWQHGIIPASWPLPGWKMQGTPPSRQPYVTTNVQPVLEMECLSQSVFYDYLKILDIYFQVGCAVETSNKFSYTLDLSHSHIHTELHPPQTCCNIGMGLSTDLDWSGMCG